MNEALSDCHPFAQGFLRRLLDQQQSRKGQPDQNCIADPGIELAQMQGRQEPALMEQVPQVEVHEIEAIARLTHKDEEPKAEEPGEQVDTRQADDKAAEEGHEQAVVDERVRHSGPLDQHCIDADEAEQPDTQPKKAGALDALVEASERDAEYEAG